MYYLMFVRMFVFLVTSYNLQLLNFGIPSSCDYQIDSNFFLLKKKDLSVNWKRYEEKFKGGKNLILLHIN